MEELLLSDFPTNRSYRVAVTGHCSFGNSASEAFVADSFRSLVAAIKQSAPAGVTALSALAVGADTLFAETSLALDIPVEAVMAHAQIIETFPVGSARRRFESLLAHCQHIYRLPFAHGSNGDYMAMGYWLVDHSDLLVAAWNGLPAKDLGGTADVVAYARRVGRPVLHLHTVEHCMTWMV